MCFKRRPDRYFCIIRVEDWGIISLCTVYHKRFSLHKKDGNRFGGGLLLYIRSDIPHRRRCDLEPNCQISHGIEIMVIEGRLYKMEKWHLVIIHKPPKVTKNYFENTLTEICQSLEKESPHWFIMGDTNFDVSHEKSLSDLCVVYDLSNLVDGPTCFKGDTPSSIDVLLSTEPKRCKNSLNSSCSISDFHNLTCVATKLHKPHIEPKTIYYRSYRNFDDNIFLNDVQKIPFWISDAFEDEDDRWWGFGKLFSDVIDKHAPIKTRTLKKPSLPYMNSSLRRAIHKKNMLYNSYRKGKVPWKTYRKQRNLTTAINKQSKAIYFHEWCDGGSKNKRFGGQLNLLLLIKMPPFATNYSSRRGQNYYWHPGNLWNTQCFFSRRWLMTSGLMTSYHPTITQMKVIHLSLKDIVATPVLPR